MQKNQKINMNFILKELIVGFILLESILIELVNYIFYLNRKNDIYCFIDIDCFIVQIL